MTRRTSDQPCVMNVIADELNKLTSYEVIKSLSQRDRKNLERELMNAVERIDKTQ
jgi:hypothetical protein